MAVYRYAFYYAIIDLDTRMCVEVQDTTDYIGDITFIRIPTYNEDYIEKYYIDGVWYKDADGTIVWDPNA